MIGVRSVEVFDMAAPSKRSDSCDCDLCDSAAQGWEEKLNWRSQGSFDLAPVKRLIGCATLILSFLLVLGWYDSHFFRIRVVEDPLEDQRIVETTDPYEIAFFRRKTVPEVVDPALHELALLKNLRKETLQGTVKPPDYARRRQAILEKLIDIMDVAKLRVIPKVDARKYESVLYGVGEAYQSAQALGEALDPERSLEDRQRAHLASQNLSKQAKVHLESGKDYFYCKKS